MEWALIAPFLPAPKRVGRPRTTDLRDVFNRNPLYSDDRMPVANAAQ